MRLDDIVLRYQKKIGSYDKEKWEKTLEEQKTIENALNFPLRTAKLKTDLIDVDLVRGSTFPKAKPKQSLTKVLYLSLLRYFLLPLFAKWWVRETSAKVFVVLLSLYFLQMINWAIYSLHIKSFNDANNTSNNNNNENDGDTAIELCELLIPMALSLLLCFIHSQIVATSVFPSRSSKNRRQKLSYGKNCVNDKIRRKKKVFRQRPTSMSSMQGYDSDDDEQTVKASMLNANKLAHIDTNISSRNESNTSYSSILVSPPSSSSLSSPPPSSSVRRRNVNWNLSNNSENQENVDAVACEEIPDAQHPLRQRRGFNNPLAAITRSTEDDGFESLTGKSSSGEEVRPTENIGESDDSDTETLRNSTPVKSNSKNDLGTKKRRKELSCSESEENNDFDSLTPTSSSNHHFETTDIGVTSNSESECADDDANYTGDDDDNVPAKILNPNDSSEKVSVTLWTKHEAKKAEMSVLEISSAIIQRVDLIPETYDYVYIGGLMSLCVSLTPLYCRLCDVTKEHHNSTNNIFDLPRVIDDSFSFATVVQLSFGDTTWERIILTIATFQRLVLAFCFFFLLAVAERTFKQRFLYAKLFSHLTSTRRARKSLIPHFRLNKVRNIKTWLSVRSYLKRLGPQRSVDIIVSGAFITTLILLAFLSLEFLKDSEHIHSQVNLEALVFSSCCGIYLLRFFTLGAKINKKYRSISVLITEQINLYVQIEQKPQKKEELNVSNSVLKLASDLLKELDSPFKISGLSANSYLYNTVKVVVLSALSGVLSEMLGFKLKLHKIKIK